MALCHIFIKFVLENTFLFQLMFNIRQFELALVIYLEPEVKENLIIKQIIL